MSDLTAVILAEIRSSDFYKGLLDAEVPEEYAFIIANTENVFQYTYTRGRDIGRHYNRWHNDKMYTPELVAKVLQDPKNWDHPFRALDQVSRYTYIICGEKVVDLLSIDYAENLNSVIQDYQSIIDYLKDELDDDDSHRIAIEILREPEYRNKPVYVNESLKRLLSTSTEGWKLPSNLDEFMLVFDEMFYDVGQKIDERDIVWVT